MQFNSTAFLHRPYFNVIVICIWCEFTKYRTIGHILLQLLWQLLLLSSYYIIIIIITRILEARITLNVCINVRCRRSEFATRRELSNTFVAVADVSRLMT